MLGEKETCDEKAGENEEEIDAEAACRQEIVVVAPDHQQNCDAAKAIEPGDCTEGSHCLRMAHSGANDDRFLRFLSKRRRSTTVSDDDVAR